jgi:hypothetical protein
VGLWGLLWYELFAHSTQWKLHDHIDIADNRMHVVLSVTLTKTAIIRKKKYNVLMSTAVTANLFGKIWIAQKQGLS